jgi:hypothetical protein
MADEPRTERNRQTRALWNEGKLTGPKPPLKVREIWAIRIRLQLAHKLRDLALFNLAIDSKLRGCALHPMDFKTWVGEHRPIPRRRGRRRPGDLGADRDVGNRPASHGEES